MATNSSAGPHVCVNCGHRYTGKICNMCGEKVFNEKQLSAGHFFHQVIDFFYHFESKVLKTIKLNFLKPGFVTKENLRGVHVPYAKPVQLYLIVNLVFYLVISKVGVTDYIPNQGDHHYYELSMYPIFKWAQPLDEKVVAAIDSAYYHKQQGIYTDLLDNYAYQQETDSTVKIFGPWRKDSTYLSASQIKLMAFEETRKLTRAAFYANVKTFGKTLLFLILPIVGGLFYLFFFKKIKYYGAALTLATHFLVYNMCFYSLYSILNKGLSHFHIGLLNWMSAPFDALFYNSYTSNISTFIFGGEFEFLHLLFWMPWLYIAFGRLFNTAWWKNLLISYLLSRIFFYLIFGMLKKVVIAITIWSIH
jgi:Protein of unknown function (DUF3667)